MITNLSHWIQPSILNFSFFTYSSDNNDDKENYDNYTYIHFDFDQMYYYTTKNKATEESLVDHNVKTIRDLSKLTAVEVIDF